MFWLEHLKQSGIREGQTVNISSVRYRFERGILRQAGMHSRRQKQTGSAFAFKWSKRSTYESERFQDNVRRWLIKRYLGGRPAKLARWLAGGSRVLDAGCGSGFSASLFFGKAINRIHYLGADISGAVDVARRVFEEKRLQGEFIQADILKLPFSGPTFDLIFSEGVMHHTDSTQRAIKYLSKLLLPSGRFLFYVYRKKAPVREFCDDHIRSCLLGLSDEQAWNTLKPLTRLGKALGDLNITVDVPEAIPYLEIPKGKIGLQSLFYWYFCKAYYKPDFDLDEMNHVNFDWYRPLNCHRHTPAEIRKWCKEAGLSIERFNVELSGISVVARKPGGRIK
jgi:SAM-dependent methyltransferase